MNSDGTDPIPLYPTGIFSSHFSFSPDGNVLALFLPESLNPPGGIFVLPIDPPGGPVFLTDGVSPDWSSPLPCAEIDCSDGVDNEGDGLVDCDDADCLNDPACTGGCGQNKAPCVTGDDCCSGNCKRGKCRGKGKSAGSEDKLTAMSFLRGDSNTDGAVDPIDPIHTLNYLFLGGPAPICADAADSDDNGRLEITDPVFTLGWLFQGVGELPSPGPEVCGPDTTEDALTDCEYEPVNC